MNALKKETARGMKVIVIDPRITESARFAEVHLQPYPGEDPTVIGGLMRIILAEGWEDKEFCTQYVKPGGLEAMRKAVEPFTPDYVARRAGVPADLLYKAAALFARDSKKGAAYSATGPSMSPRGNLSDHLIETLNVVCGRLRRAGDRVRDINVCAPPRPLHAEVIPGTRSWEKLPPGRIRGAHSVWGEMFTCTLADEILAPGDGQIRALIVGGGNPVTGMPDQRKTVKAFRALELLVSIEPYMTTTAKLSHYILPPKLQYERADMPMALYGMSFYPIAWGQYTPELLKPPAGSEVADDWYVYWSLAKRMGLTLKYGDKPIDMEKAPTTEELFALRSENAVVSLAEIQQHPKGHVWDIEGTVLPARPEATGRFDIMPDDLLAEMLEIAGETVQRPGQFVSNGQRFSHRLSVRRSRDTVNSVGPLLQGVRERHRYNPVWINPDDMTDKNLRSGDRVEIISDHGRIEAVVAADATVKRGVISMTHGWGGLPDENLAYEELGVSPNLLIDTETNIEPINSMVRMSAIPVNIQRLPNYRPGDELRYN
jgi:anaerobic selenocysteine-containing dehydrogenase